MCRMGECGVTEPILDENKDLLGMTAEIHV